MPDPHRRTRASYAAVLAALGLGAALAAACYSERLPPPAYRYACDGDGDCEGDEECRDGLCEIPCSLLDFAETCGDGFVACFNGACASTCEVGADDVCPDRQECVDLSELGIEIAGASGSSPFGGGSSDVVLGLCGRRCESGDGLCGDGETCIEGFCVPTCDETVEPDPCPTGFSCTFGLCVPGDAAGSDDGAPADGDDGSGGSGDGDAGSGSEGGTGS